MYIHGEGGLHPGGRGFASRGGLHRGGCIQGVGGLSRPPSPVSRQTGVKTLPCPKLRLLAVKIGLRECVFLASPRPAADISVLKYILFLLGKKSTEKMQGISHLFGNPNYGSVFGTFTKYQRTKGIDLQTAVAVSLGGSASVHVGIHNPPGCGPGYPPRCGPGDPPRCGPGQTPQPHPWVWAWRPARHAGIPPPETCRACWDTTPPLWTDRHV